MSFARADSGSFTGLVDATPNWKIAINQATVGREFYAFDTTSSGESAKTGQTSDRFVYRVEGTGWLEDGSNNRLRLSDNVSSLSGSVYGKNSLAVLIKDHGEPVNVTAAEDAAPASHFELALPTYSGGIRTHLQTTETPLDSATAHNDPAGTLTLPLGGSKTVSATAIVSLIRHKPSFKGGGPIEADFQFRFSGSVTNMGTPFEVNEFSASLDLNNGQTMTGTVKMNQVRVDLDYRRAGPVPFRFQGVFDGDPGFA